MREKGGGRRATGPLCITTANIKGPFNKKVSAAQVSRELRSEENGIFLVVVQTCFNHRNEHKIQLVPSAIVWNSFPSSRWQLELLM